VRRPSDPVIGSNAMARSRYLDFLASVPLFSGCSQRELQAIARSSTEIALDAGSELVTQGEPGREAFVILEGAVVVRRNGRKVATLGPGDCVGEMALLDHGPRTASAVTTAPTRALALDAK